MGGEGGMEREKKRQTDRQTSIGCPLYMPHPGIELEIFWCMG